MGVSVTGNGFSVGTGGTNPGYFNSDSFQLADDLDLVRGDHQLSFGGNWIHTKIETLNNRPTNGAFTFNGQATGLGARRLHARPRERLSCRAIPVYDFDDHDYVGAYVQDEWRVRSNLTLNAGLRWEPFIPSSNTLGWASNFDQARFDQGIRSTVYPQAPAGPVLPGRCGLSGATAMTRQQDGAVRAAARASIWTPRRRRQHQRPRRLGQSSTTRRTCSSTRGSPTTRRGARRSRSRTRRAGSPIRTSTYPGGNPFPALTTGWATPAVPGVRRLRQCAARHRQPTSLQQWNISAQRQVGDWMLSASYLGNHVEQPVAGDRAEPGGVTSPGATTGNTNQRRALYLQNPAQGQFYGTHRPARRHRPRRTTTACCCRRSGG